MIRSIRDRVMTTCGLSGPFILLAVGFGIGFTLAIAWH